MHRIPLIAAATAAGLLAVGTLLAEEPKKADKPKTKEQVKEMMTKLHKGEKSALARTRAELEKDQPDWEQLAKDAKAFAEMGDVLKVSASPYTNPTGYIDGAAALAKASAAKDKAEAGKAMTAFGRSCSACHYGNPAE